MSLDGFARERGFRDYADYNAARIHFGEDGWHTYAELMERIRPVSKQEPRKITEAELAEALSRTQGRLFTWVTTAKDIVDDVIANREPEWKPGDVVEDAQGRWWLRGASGVSWYKFGVAGPCSMTEPVRPLTHRGREKW